MAKRGRDHHTFLHQFQSVMKMWVLVLTLFSWYIITCHWSIALCESVPSHITYALIVTTGSWCRLSFRGHSDQVCLPPGEQDWHESLRQPLLPADPSLHQEGHTLLRWTSDDQKSLAWNPQDSKRGVLALVNHPPSLPACEVKMSDEEDEVVIVAVMSNLPTEINYIYFSFKIHSWTDIHTTGHGILMSNPSFLYREPQSIARTVSTQLPVFASNTLRRVSQISSRRGMGCPVPQMAPPATKRQSSARMGRFLSESMRCRDLEAMTGLWMFLRSLAMRMRKEKMTSIKIYHHQGMLHCCRKNHKTLRKSLKTQKNAKKTHSVQK